MKKIKELAKKAIELNNLIEESKRKLLQTTLDLNEAIEESYYIPDNDQRELLVCTENIVRELWDGITCITPEEKIRTELNLIKKYFD